MIELFFPSSSPFLDASIPILDILINLINFFSVVRGFHDISVGLVDVVLAMVCFLIIVILETINEAEVKRRTVRGLKNFETKHVAHIMLPKRLLGCSFSFLCYIY